MIQDHDPAEVVAALDEGRVLWPGAERVHDVETSAATLADLAAGRRRFWAVETYDPDSPRVGDLLCFSASGSWRLLFVIVLRWEHDGIAPGWAIASLRPVALTLQG